VKRKLRFIRSAVIAETCGKTCPTCQVERMVHLGNWNDDDGRAVHACPRCDASEQDGLAQRAVSGQ
jgi:hypothetical protein